ncbi:hypothetical protein OAG68_02425 [bacterium]|nr:hypothetical protein [bacterium]
MYGMRNGLQKFLIALLVLVVCSASGFAGGPENLLLVVNADSPSSMLIANHYIALRNIPERNVVYLSEIPDREVATLEQVKTKILEPVLSEIQKRKLSGNIDYIVYSSDFPTQVNIQSHLTKLIELAKEQGQPIPDGNRKIFKPRASLNSVTFFADSVLRDEPAYMLLNSNFYYRGSAAKILEQPFVAETQQAYQDALAAAQRDPAESISLLKKLEERHPRQVAVSYQLAKLYALTGDYEAATKWLGISAENGWSFRGVTEVDPAFSAAIENSSEFRERLAEVADDPVQMPTVGFRRNKFWAPNGSVNEKVDQGRGYFLSTVLAVTRNEGCTEAEALAGLKRNAVVDGTKPSGTFYFADTTDVRNTTRQPNYREAIVALDLLGQKSRVIKDKIPVKQDRVMGVTIGTSQFDWETGGSNLLPGAIGDNLTSYGGGLNLSPQTKCTEFIAAGAAGASGTVIEPYALQAKFPHPMIHAHYARGSTLAEAFYQSVHGPFQLLIIGDALCQPFATIPKLEHDGVAPETVISGAIEIGLDFSKSPVPCKSLEMYIDGLQVKKRPLSDKLRFDSSKIPDGYHELRVVAVAEGLLETTGRIVLPVFVDNHGYRVDLSADRDRFKSTDDVVFRVQSNYGERVVLRQNYRVLGEKLGQDVQFSIPASKLGRGPVKLTAVMFDENGIPVSSVPLSFTVTGDISETRRITEPRLKASQN